MPEESNPPAISQPVGEAEAPTAYTEAAARFVARPPGASAPFRVGRYRVVCLIGEGGMGAVYEVEHEIKHAEGGHGGHKNLFDDVNKKVALLIAVSLPFFKARFSPAQEAVA